MPPKYSLEDVTKSYRWLGHKGFTELNAFHSDYKTGREHFEWNLQNKTFPRISYARTENDVINFVKKYAETYMVCYGINPRQKIFKNNKNYPRAAYENEIELSQNLLMDFDFKSKNTTKEQIAEFELFIQKTNQYFLELGIKIPTTAYTGRGYHFLFAYPPIKVTAYPDIAERLKEFCNQFRETFKKDLQRLEVKLDNTQDLRRMLKIYGTAKPKIGIISKFYGDKRMEDNGLRDYLLKMEIHQSESELLSVLKTSGELPLWFQNLLAMDSRIKELWEGYGKPQDTDTTGSGYDFSLAKYLLNLGYQNIGELATILALRPEGAVRKSGKGDGYIRRTIANALMK